MNYTETLAHYAANLKFEDIPKETIDMMKIMTLDYLSCAFGGTQTDSGRIAAEFARDFSEQGKCTVIGFGYKSAPYNAAFANGILSHSIEMDDADIQAFIHTAPQTVSPALAAAEWVNADGKDFLTGITIGSEFVNRINEAINPSLRDRGFHTTPTAGVFGAGAAAGRIMKLDATKMVSVLGLSGAQASGLMEMYGVSMAKRFNPGPCARNGVTAALFAQRGFTGAETILEGPRGFCRAFADKCEFEKLIRDLGKDFRVSVELKPYACARPIHNAIDTALNIRKKNQFDLSEIESMVMKRHSSWGTSYHYINEPRTFHEAQMSLPFSTALALVLGKAFVDEYCDENLKNPQIMGLSKILKIENDDTLPRGVSCRLIIKLKNGKVLEEQVDWPKGSLKNPMNAEERFKKFEALSAKVLTDAQRKQIAETVNKLETLKSIRELTALLGPF